MPEEQSLHLLSLELGSRPGIQGQILFPVPASGTKLDDELLELLEEELDELELFEEELELERDDDDDELEDDELGK